MGIRKRKITSEQMAYAIAHLNDRPRTSVAKAAGISLNTLYKIVREKGGEMDYSSNSPNIKARDITIAEYPHLSTQEIANKYGLTKSLVIRWAKKLGLHHTPETTIRLKLKCKDARLLAHNDASYRKGCASRKRIRRIEEFRVKSGMPQKTKFRISVMPKRVYKAIWHLTRKRNYFTDEEVGGKYTIYYDNETHRTSCEHYYTDKYGLTFRQA